jgi:hypothetical protein
MNNKGKNFFNGQISRFGDLLCGPPLRQKIPRYLKGFFSIHWGIIPASVNTSSNVFVPFAMFNASKNASAFARSNTSK